MQYPEISGFLNIFRDCIACSIALRFSTCSSISSRHSNFKLRYIYWNPEISGFWILFRYSIACSTALRFSTCSSHSFSGKPYISSSSAAGLIWVLSRCQLRYFDLLFKFHSFIRWLFCVIVILLPKLYIYFLV